MKLKQRRGNFNLNGKRERSVMTNMLVLVANTRIYRKAYHSFVSPFNNSRVNRSTKIYIILEEREILFHR